MSDRSREFVELLCVTARLGAFQSVPADVVALAGEAPRLSDEQVRAALVALADRAARRPGVRPR